MVTTKLRDFVHFSSIFRLAAAASRPINDMRKPVPSQVEFARLAVPASRENKKWRIVTSSPTCLVTTQDISCPMNCSPQWGVFWVGGTGGRVPVTIIERNSWHFRPFFFGQFLFKKLQFALIRGCFGILFVTSEKWNFCELLKTLQNRIYTTTEKEYFWIIYTHIPLTMVFLIIKLESSWLLSGKNSYLHTHTIDNGIFDNQTRKFMTFVGYKFVWFWEHAIYESSTKMWRRSATRRLMIECLSLFFV